MWILFCSRSGIESETRVVCSALGGLPETPYVLTPVLHLTSVPCSLLIDIWVVPTYWII